MPGQQAKAGVSLLNPCHHPLVVAAVAVATGMVIDRLHAMPWQVWGVAAGCTWFAWLLLRQLGWSRTASVALLLCLTALGGAWHHDRWRLFADDVLGLFASEVDQPAAVEGVVVSAPRLIPKPPVDPVRPIPVGDRTQLQIEATAIRDGDRWVSATGQVQLTVDGHLLGVQAGDTVRIFGRMDRPRPAGNPGEFDRALQLRGDRILATLHCGSPDCVEVLTMGSPWRIARWWGAARAYGDRMLWQNVKPDEAGLAAAVLLGGREELDPDQIQAFMVTGTIHIITIAGLHVGILAFLLFQALRLGCVPRGPALLTVVIVTIVYAWLTGAEPPVMRAAIMIVIVCWSLWRGQGGLKFNSLAAAALAIIVYNPADLFRPGAQLSFLAVACFAWIGSRWSHWFRRDALDKLIADTRPWPVKVWNSIRHRAWQLFVASAIVFAVTAPLVMSRFHTLSPVSILLSVLLQVPITIAMMAGFGVLIFGSLLPDLAAACGWLCDVALAAINKCVVVAGHLPGNHYWVPGPDNWWLIGFYGGLALLLAFPFACPPRRWLAASVIGWCAIGGGVSWWNHRPNPDRMEYTFVSVGHGLAVVLHLPDGRTMLYDSGSMISPHVASRAVAGYLWQRGITHLDGVFVSHADTDHYNALPDLLDRFTISAVYVSPVMFKDRVPALMKLKSAIEAHGVPIRETWRGDRVLAGENCRIDVLHPPRAGLRASDNANCVVLAVDFEGHRVLLTGDLEPPGLDQVIAEEEWKCDVLSAPHHGSIRSLPNEMLAWCLPTYVAISGGERENTLKVRSAYSAIGSRILNTVVDGAITVAFEHGKTSVKTFRNGVVAP